MKEAIETALETNQKLSRKNQLRIYEIEGDIRYWSSLFETYLIDFEFTAWISYKSANNY